MKDRGRQAVETVLKKDERIDSLFQHNLQIIQSSSVFSFSLDAILLGEFASVPKHSRANIVDLCAGNGAVTLMLAAQTQSKVTGVEIQERLVDMAQRSIRLNKLEEQIAMLQTDLKEVTQQIRKDSVDIVTCNPPYFPISEESRKNPNEHLAIARHEIHATLDDVVRTMADLLKTNGKAYMVHRPDRFLEIMDVMRKYCLAPKKVRFVYPKEHKEANMILIEGIKQGKETGFKVLSPLYVFDEEDKYLPEVRRMIYGDGTK